MCQYQFYSELENDLPQEKSSYGAHLRPILLYLFTPLYSTRKLVGIMEQHP